MLDTFSLAEVWRRAMDRPAFAPAVLERLAAASRWLATMVDPTSGDAPNLGANDGANLLPLTDAGYRDFRPAVALGASLFEHVRRFADVDVARDHLSWLGIDWPARDAPLRPSTSFDDGGYAVLVRGAASAVLRYPRARFRPGHADPMHVDLWVAGENVLRDDGTFSYHADAATMAGFGGIRSHNSIAFDEREPMPRLGRFLWGAWLDAERTEPLHVDDASARAGASYVDTHGARHSRSLRLTAQSLIVDDRVDPDRHAVRAILRWRLSPGPWRLDAAARAVRDDKHSLHVVTGMSVHRVELVTAWESRHYAQRSELPVLEVEFAPLPGGRITTTVTW